MKIENITSDDVKKIGEIYFYEDEFNSHDDFGASMFEAAKRFKDVNGIVVTYVKEYNKKLNKTNFHFIIQEEKEKEK